jgi:two-component system, LuxR family, response regulator FixJ
MSAKRALYVVDDEEAIRRSLRLMLGVQGYSVTVFASGASLLDALDGLVPGCLLLDVRMPGIDGLEVQRELAARGGRLPTVVMTGHGEFSVALAALRNGAVSFLEKPFTKAAAVQALELAFLQLEGPDDYERHLEAMAARVAALDLDERNVLACLAAGHSEKAMSAQLAVDLAEIEMRRSRILAKLEAAGYGRD